MAGVGMHHKAKTCQGENDIEINERVAETCGKRTLDGLFFKEDFAVGGQLEPG